MFSDIDTCVVAVGRKHKRSDRTLGKVRAYFGATGQYLATAPIAKTCGGVLRLKIPYSAIFVPTPYNRFNQVPTVPRVVIAVLIAKIIGELVIVLGREFRGYVYQQVVELFGGVDD